MTRPVRGMPQPPAARSRDFTGSAIRLVTRLTPLRGMTAAVIALGVCGIAIGGVIGPRILGHATDLLFNGVIGRRLPAGISKEQAIEAARARGDNTFADLLSGMNVIPGHGVDFGAVGRTLLLALGLYLVAALMVWVQARILNVVVQRTIATLRTDIENKVHRLPLSYVDARQRGELLSRVTNDVDNVQSSLAMSISQLLTAALTVIAVLVMMLTISPLLALLTVLTVPLSLLATRAITRRSQKLFVAQWTNTGRLNATSRKPTAVSPSSRPTATATTPARSSPSSTTMSTAPAPAHSSCPASWGGRPPRSSATSVMWPWRWSAASRWRPARSPWAVSRRSSSTCASSTSR